MADELSVLAGVIDNETGQRYGGGGFDVDRTAEAETAEHIQDIGTTEEALAIAPLTTTAGCVAYFKNLDDTNYVEVRQASGAGEDILKLKAGEEYTIRLGSDVATPYAIANTDTVKLKFKIWKE